MPLILNNLYSYIDDLIRAAKSDSAVSSNIGNLILEYSSKKTSLSACDTADTYYGKFNLKDLQTQSARVREYANVYYNNGNFTQFNIVFSKFIRYFKDLGNSEMNGFIIKYFISSSLKKNWENAISDIQSLKQTYTAYDLNIYI